MDCNFKQIKIIPTANDLTDIILSNTQIKIPTVEHPNDNISKIRSFYMGKIKFTCESIHEKFTELLENFPKLDDIHPFYANLINVLYNKDHYKIALGHVYSARNLIDNIAKDYVRFLKYGDSLYRCKMLKRAALRRMVEVIKKLDPSLVFLKQVRKHLSTIPSIDPYTHTLLITGFPNVGKSSFINQITKANIEVQPYPFTTRSLFVGHTDHNYVSWQVIDTPGLLDQPLEQRTTIEMQSIIALAHLEACILYFIDISETCGYSINQQISLYEGIRPLFANKPFVIVFNKIDLQKFDELNAEEQQKLNILIEQNGVTTAQMSTMSGEGIVNAKETACNLLLEYRLRNKLDKAPSNDLNKPTLKEEDFFLEDSEWISDLIPKTMGGKKIADFLDKDIEQKLMELEREEEMLILGRTIVEKDVDEEENNTEKTEEVKVENKEEVQAESKEQEQVEKTEEIKEVQVEE